MVVNWICGLQGMVSLIIAGEDPLHPRYLDWETVGVIHDNFRFRYLFGQSLMKHGGDMYDEIDKRLR